MHAGWIENLPDDEVEVIWAALCSMVEDIHAPQDCLNERKWVVATKLLDEFEHAMTHRSKPCSDGNG